MNLLLKQYTALALTGLLLSACTLANQEEVVDFERHPGEYAAQVSEFLVFEDADQWLAFYNEHGLRFTSPEPPVDFADRVVVAAYFGVQSGCPPNEPLELIHSIEKSSDVLVVTLQPIPDLGDCEALVPVYDLVSIDRRDARDEVSFDQSAK